MGSGDSFNSRAREGRDSAGDALGFSDTVSTHAPARGATCSVVAAQDNDLRFQLTRPRGARLVRAFAFAEPDLFQLTRPRGARPELIVIDDLGKGFNSRAREGRDRPHPYAYRGRQVSTHAPARGATVRSYAPQEDEEVSTHAPARGATRRRRRSRRRLKVSTHAPARGATIARAAEGPSSDVSTHAPARGATGRLRPCRAAAWKFQLTRPRGARRFWLASMASTQCFNSRAREGRDRGGPHRCRSSVGFNSRAREGRDLVALVGEIAEIVSTHAPARGATRELLVI